MDSRYSSSADSRLISRAVGSISPPPICARVESYEAGEKKCISDVRRTFCLFVTFDLLFITMLWIIELNVRCVCVIDVCQIVCIRGGYVFTTDLQVKRLDVSEVKMLTDRKLNVLVKHLS